MPNDLNETNEEKEQAEHLKQVYSDKAGNLLKWVIGILIFNLVTYGVFAILGNVDFGVLFEVITFVFVLIAINLVSKYSVEQAKSKIIIAIIPVGLLLIYDLIDFSSHLEQVAEELTNYYQSFSFIFYNYSLNLTDITLFVIIILLVGSYRSLCKASGDKKYQENTDWFYNKK